MFTFSHIFFNDNRLRVTKLPSAMPPSRKAKEKTDENHREEKTYCWSTNSPSLLALLLKKLTREDCRLAIFSYKLRIYKFPKTTCGLSKCNRIPRAGIFICFLWLHCVIGTCASQTLKIKNAFLAGNFLYKNEVSDNFP